MLGSMVTRDLVSLGNPNETVLKIMSSES